MRAHRTAHGTSRRLALAAPESRWNQAQCEDPTPGTGVQSVVAAALAAALTALESHTVMACERTTPGC